VIAVVLDERGSETTDALVPYGVLARSGIADVFMFSAQTTPVKMFPALTVRPQTTFEAFDSRYPEGADYVIVPASHRLERSSIVPWIRRQAASEATVIGICAGAKLLAVAGLLQNRRGTTHWYELEHLRRLEPSMTYVPDRRYILDGQIATTTGVTASLPMALTVVEAIGGKDRAQSLAAELGTADWSAAHDSAAFQTNRTAVLTGLANRFSFRRGIAISIQDGVDEISLAFTADAWSRTYRSAALTVSDNDQVISRHGLSVIGDRSRSAGLRTIEPPLSVLPATALDQSLAAIQDMFGQRTAEFVALQLEYQFH
jgi:putative intracellular protease/amidase